jgi:hypothetical protein
VCSSDLEFRSRENLLKDALYSAQKAPTKPRRRREEKRSPS